MESTTVAVDLAKSVFEVAVANERGQITERKRCGRTAFMRFAELDRELRELAAADPVCALLQTVPGIGLLGATTLVGTVGHIHAFGRGRQFASWVGLTPREYSSGGHRRTGQPLSRLHRWALQVRDRCHFNLAIVAVANTLARLVWAVWTRDTAFVAA